MNLYHLTNTLSIIFERNKKLERSSWYVVVEIAEKINVISCMGNKFYFKTKLDVDRFVEVIQKKFKVKSRILKHGGFEVEVMGLIEGSKDPSD